MTAPFYPETMLLPCGLAIPFHVLYFCIADMVFHGRIDPLEEESLVFWIDSYRCGGALPGCNKFRSPFTGNMVFFLKCIEDINSMFQIAMEFADENRENHFAIDADGSEACFQEWPIDIGRFHINGGMIDEILPNDIFT